MRGDKQHWDAVYRAKGPQAERCSGLPVVRYSPEQLQQALGPRFQLRATRREAHRTPGDKVQHCVYCRFRRGG